jgi:hypothetical protein
MECLVLPHHIRFPDIPAAASFLEIGLVLLEKIPSKCHRHSQVGTSLSKHLRYPFPLQAQV